MACVGVRVLFLQQICVFLAYCHREFKCLGTDRVGKLNSISELFSMLLFFFFFFFFNIPILEKNNTKNSLFIVFLVYITE